MAPNREQAKRSITEESPDDPELSEALFAAHEYQFKMVQEQNRHQEAIHRSEIGFIGRAFGGEKAAPTYIAALSVVLGLAASAYCWLQVNSVSTPEIMSFWSAQAERALAFSGAALAFIFGRGAGGAK